MHSQSESESQKNSNCMYVVGYTGNRGDPPVPTETRSGSDVRPTLHFGPSIFSIRNKQARN